MNPYVSAPQDVLLTSVVHPSESAIQPAYYNNNNNNNNDVNNNNVYPSDILHGNSSCDAATLNQLYADQEAALRKARQAAATSALLVQQIQQQQRQQQEREREKARRLNDGAQILSLVHHNVVHHAAVAAAHTAAGGAVAAPAVPDSPLSHSSSGSSSLSRSLKTAEAVAGVATEPEGRERLYQQLMDIGFEKEDGDEDAPAELPAEAHSVFALLPNQFTSAAPPSLASSLTPSPSSTGQPNAATATAPAMPRRVRTPPPPGRGTVSLTAATLALDGSLSSRQSSQVLSPPSTLHPTAVPPPLSEAMLSPEEAAPQEGNESQPQDLVNDPDRIGMQQRNVYITGLPPNYSSKEFRQLVSPYGPVKAYKCCTSQNIPAAPEAPYKGYGFALFYGEESAAACIAKVNGMAMGGRRLTARYCKATALPAGKPPLLTDLPAEVLLQEIKAVQQNASQSAATTPSKLNNSMSHSSNLNTPCAMMAAPAMAAAAAPPSPQAYYAAYAPTPYVYGPPPPPSPQQQQQPMVMMPYPAAAPAVAQPYYYQPVMMMAPPPTPQPYYYYPAQPDPAVAAPPPPPMHPSQHPMMYTY